LDRRNQGNRLSPPQVHIRIISWLKRLKRVSHDIFTAPSGVKENEKLAAQTQRFPRTVKIILRNN
jgi:hypothetical protein